MSIITKLENTHRTVSDVVREATRDIYPDRDDLQLVLQPDIIAALSIWGSRVTGNLPVMVTEVLGLKIHTRTDGVDSAMFIVATGEVYNVMLHERLNKLAADISVSKLLEHQS